MVNTTEIMAQQVDTEAVLKAANSFLPPILQPLVSHRYNASYTADRISSTVMTMCSLNTYSECAIEYIKEHQLEANWGTSIHTPQWFNGCLRSCGDDDMLQIGRGALDESVQHLRRNGLLSGDLTVAIDLKEKACHDKNPNMDHLIGTNRQKATAYAQCFITAQAVGGAIPANLACYPMASGEPLDYFVTNLVNDMRWNGLKLGLLVYESVLAISNFMALSDLAGCYSTVLFVQYGPNFGTKGATFGIRIGSKPHGSHAEATRNLYESAVGPYCPKVVRGPPCKPNERLEASG